MEQYEKTVSSDVELEENNYIGLKRQIVVQETVKGRYKPGDRPLSWDDRVEGVEEVVCSGDSDSITLWSGGGQSTPAPGWILLLSGEKRLLEDGRLASMWTLYGVSREDDMLG